MHLTADLPVDSEVPRLQRCRPMVHHDRPAHATLDTLPIRGKIPCVRLVPPSSQPRGQHILMLLPRRSAELCPIPVHDADLDHDNRAVISLYRGSQVSPVPLRQ